MFTRINRSGRHQYLQIVKTRREGQRTMQRVIATVGRVDELRAHGYVDTLGDDTASNSQTTWTNVPPSGPWQRSSNAYPGVSRDPPSRVFPVCLQRHPCLALLPGSPGTFNRANLGPIPIRRIGP